MRCEIDNQFTDTCPAKKYYSLSEEAFAQRSKLLDAAVAQEGPPAAYVFGTLHVDVDHGVHFLVLGRTVKQFALRTGYKG